MKSSFKSQRGSVLLVAMLLTVAIALAVGSYFSLSLSSYKMSDRSYHYSAAMNVAETGLEEGMWSINQLINGNPTAFTSTYGWATSSGNASQKFSGTAFGQNAEDYVNVFVRNYTGAGAAPLLAARSVLTLPTGAAVEKWVEVKLSKRSKFSSGLVARTRLVFAGNQQMVDSWDSTPASGPFAVSYASVTPKANVRIASPELTAGMGLRSAAIWGFVSVSGDAADNLDLGPDGLIGPLGTAAGIKDPTRISTDFSAPIDPVSQPTTDAVPLGVVTSNPPFTGTLTPADKSDPSTWTTYNLTSINATNVALTTTGYVRIMLTAAEGTSAIFIGDGTGGLTIGVDSHVAIYTAGDIRIGGNGIRKATASNETFVNGLGSTLYIYGTGSFDGKQMIKLQGDGRLTAAIYAPNANVVLTGGPNPNSDIFGSVVGSTIVLLGNTSFHYDEALGKDVLGSPYGVEKWRELTTASDRAAWVADLSF